MRSSGLILPPIEFILGETRLPTWMELEQSPRRICPVWIAAGNERRLRWPGLRLRMSSRIVAKAVATEVTRRMCFAPPNPPP